METQTIASLPKLIRPALWDALQKVFGADSEKRRLYFDSMEIEDKGGRPARILDFGCATGNASSPFVGRDYTGIDIDPALIAFAKLKFRRHPEMKFVAADVLTFEPPEPYEYVLFAGVAHHLDDELLPRILARLRELLSPTGHVYFIDPVITGRESLPIRLLMAADQGKFHRSVEAYEKCFARLGVRIVEQRLLAPMGTLVPQPEYAFFKLQ